MAKRKTNFDSCDGLCGTLFPQHSDWSAPKHFPILSGVKVIGLDIETRDPGLKEKGPGFIYDRAEVIGISIATEDESWYFPIGHLGGGNMDKEAVISYVKDVLNVADRTIVGANLQYELEGLDSIGIAIKGKLIDTQIAEALIDEEAPRGYSLEALCVKYLGRSKDEELLRNAAKSYGLLDIKASLWKMPAKYVGPYAEYDAQAPILIYKEQLKTIQNESLQGVLDLESKLLPILWLMRKRGVRVDLEKAHELSKSLDVQYKAKLLEIKKKYGVTISPWEAGAIAIAANKLKLEYPRTPTGMPSFTDDFLESTRDLYPFYGDLQDLRELDSMKNKFVDGWLIEYAHNGFVHPRWRQMASDEGGTRTGRMAASDPNPQQLPASKYRKTGKPNEFGKLIRSCLIPHDKSLRWTKFDYDQQEPRVLVHFASLKGYTGAEEVADKYRESRDFDLYNLFCAVSGLARRPTKDCYLGRCYGMGLKKLAYKFNKSHDEAKEILAKFDNAAPFVKEIADDCTRLAESRGWIKTLLGRRRHFNLWEVAKYEDRIGLPMTLDEIQRKHPGKRYKRFGTHKALNALIQGSAADMTKAAMIKVYEETGEYPYMQVHDELNFGTTGEEQEKVLQYCIENSVDMKIPVVADKEVGAHWV